MARKHEGNSTVSAAKAASSLRRLRSQIDKLDLQLLKLINERAKVAAQIGKIKTDIGETAFSPAREEEIFERVLKAHEKSKSLLETQAVRAIYREIMSGTRGLQKVLKVAYLGPQYTFSHLAAIERFGTSVEYTCVSNISAVFEEVDRGHVDFGVAPVENSTDGRIVDTLEMFLRMPHILICAEVRLRIHHNLLANTEPQQIARVYSKPQALSQCRNWLLKNLPQATLHEVHSTAIAADLASKEKTSAAIASRQAASQYGLRILFENIEDAPDNETRFAVIGQQKTARTGSDKTAIMFRLQHKPGALATVLDIFKQNKVNMTWIESFPSRTGPTPTQEYLFFIDFEGHIDDPKTARMIKSIEAKCQELRVLGSFPMAAPLDT